MRSIIPMYISMVSQCGIPVYQIATHHKGGNTMKNPNAFSFLPERGFEDKEAAVKSVRTEIATVLPLPLYRNF